MVLPCVPATATRARSARQRGQHLRARQHGDPGSAGRATSGFARRHRRGDDDGVGLADLLGPVARRRRSRPPPAGRPGPRESLRSEPLTAMPRAISSRASPRMPAPPMPTRWSARHAAGSGTGERRDAPRRGASNGGRRSPRDGTLTGGRPRHVGEPRRRVRRGERRRRFRHRRQPVGAVQRATIRVGQALRRQLVVRQDPRRRRAAARARSPPVARRRVRVRDEQRRQRRTRRSRDRGGARARDHQVGGGVGQVHPIDESLDAHAESSPGPALSRGIGERLGPSPRRARRRRAAAPGGRSASRAGRHAPTAARSRCSAPWLPPNTTTVRRRPRGRTPTRLVGERVAVRGTRHDLLADRVAREHGATRRRGTRPRLRRSQRDHVRPDAPAVWFASPGTAFCSWSTTGTRSRRAARTAGTLA